MRYCVTGSSGFIGSHVVKALRDAGNDVVELDLKIGYDIRKFRDCQRVQGSDVVIHLAAIADVRQCEANRSAAHETNVTGFLNVLEASMDAGRFVYASSAAVHGNTFYGATKRANEAYAAIRPSVGLRYYNVYGRGSHGVIALWADKMKRGAPVEIHGDGEQKRDFIHVSEIVKATLDSRDPGVYEVKTGNEMTLNQLFGEVAAHYKYTATPIYVDHH